VVGDCIVGNGSVDAMIFVVVDVDVFRTVPERSVDVPLPAVIFTKESIKPAAGVCAASITAEEEFSIRRVNLHYVCRMYRKLKLSVMSSSP
jgi:hypothetical protein